MTRIFLDANILFSAVYNENASLLKLWQISNLVLITSDYAVQEATVNLSEAPRGKPRGISAEFRRSQPAFALPSFGEVRPAIHPRGKPRGILAKANKTEQRDRLTKLLRAVTVQNYPVDPPILPAFINLPEKDIPILQAAIIGNADILLTGDISHFGRYFGKTICGVRIMRPTDFLHRPVNDSSTSIT